MKTKKLTVLFTLVSALLLLINIFLSVKPTNALVDRGALVLNNINYIINENNEQRFYYTPEDSRYYVVETSGRADTILKVINSSTEIVNDNINSSNLNSRIWFKANAGNQFTVDIKFRNSERMMSTLQLRKQRFSMFGYKDENGNDFKKDFEKPLASFNNLFEIVKCEDKSASYATDVDERDLSRINSEMVFYTGHGLKNSSTKEFGTGICFYSNGMDSYIYNNSFMTLNEIKVAMWSACYSANSNNAHKISFAEHSVNCGATSAVGFLDSVATSSARTFTNKFFSTLAGGGTVAEAASAGKGAIIWAWDKAKNYILLGNRTIRVTDESPLGENFYSISSNYEYLRTELTEGYISEPLDGNDIRYYQTINGYETDSYIDITESEGKIIAIDDRRKPFDSVLSIEDSLLTKSCEANEFARGRNFFACEETEEHIVYCNFEGTMTPVKVKMLVYTGNGGEVFCEAACINLNDGSTVDYEQICGFEE